MIIDNRSISNGVDYESLSVATTYCTTTEHNSFYFCIKIMGEDAVMMVNLNTGSVFKQSEFDEQETFYPLTVKMEIS